MQAVLNLVWEHLLPAMKASAPLPADAADGGPSRQEAREPVVPPQAGRPTVPVARQVTGQLYELPKNDDGIEAIGLETGSETTLVVRISGHDHRVPVGQGEWRRGGTWLAGEVEQKVAATGAWTSDDTYTVKACQYETPFCRTLSLWFTGRALVLDEDMNVGFGPTKRPQIVGRLRKP